MATDQGGSMIIVKERPIPFSRPMVRAVLDDRKTTTRRALSVRALKNISIGAQIGECHELPTEGPLHPNSVGYYNDFCPYGKPGDRLWGRENWWQAGDWLASYPEDDAGAWCGSRRVVYTADGKPPNEPNNHYPSGLRNGAYSAAEPNKIWRHRPSIHMYRWASRILLEITDVRIERLQDISEEQAIAEGCFFTDYGRQCGHGGTGWKDVGDCPAPESAHQQRNGWMWDTTTSHEQCLGSARHAFGNLWESLGGNWDANPWVWVVEFRRLTL